MSSGNSEDSEAARRRLVESLQNPSAYQHPVSGPVEHIATHISDVFLVGEFAYKVKKSVDFGFCDFTTPDLRAEMSRRELDLNHRLSDKVYLSVEPVMLDPESGDYSIDGNGEPVDTALKMRRLSSDNQLDRLLRQGAAGANEIHQIARLLAIFHRDADPAPPEFADVEGVSGIVLGNLGRVAEHAPPELDTAAFASISAYARAFLKHRADQISQRHDAGVPRMCHGDLHAANIFIETDSKGERKMQVIDCIEFNDNFVYIDPAADLAFLSMDLKRIGHSDLAELLVETYIEATGDPEIRTLLPFYESYRAMVRCMAASISARQSPESDRQSHIENAQAYLALASEIAALDLPLSVVVMAGPTGTGKSTVAKLVAENWNAVHLQTDAIRREIAGLGPTERSDSGLHGGIYTKEMSERTYREMFRRARAALAAGKSVVMDGTHLRKEFRTSSLAVTAGSDAVTSVIECDLPERDALLRLEARYASGRSESEGRPEVYARQIKAWQPVNDDEADVVVRVDTGVAQSELANSLFSQLWDGVLNAPG